MKKQLKFKDILFYSYETALFLVFLYFVWAIKLAVQKNVQNLPVPLEALPNQLLYWIPLCLLIIPIALPKIDIKKKLFSLILLCFAVFLAYPLFNLYGHPYGRDSSYAYQLTNLIAENGEWYPGMGTGQAKVYSHYPAMYLYNILFSKLTGLELKTSFMWAFNLLRLIFIPVLIFFLYKKIFSVPLSLISVLLYISSPSLTNHPQHEGFAIIFLIVTLIAILYLDDKKLLKNFLIILFSSLTILSHHFTSYILLSWLIFLFLFGKIYLLIKSRKNKQIKSYYVPLVSGRVLLIILIIFFSWGIYSSLGDLVIQSKSVSSVFLTILTPKTDQITDIEKINFTSINLTSLENMTEEEFLQKVFQEQKKEKQSITQKLSFSKITNILKNIINPSAYKIPLDVGTSFKKWEKITIFTSIILIFFFLFFGFIITIKKENLPQFYWANFWFSIMLIFLSSIMIFTQNYFILRRIFEFAYIGIIPMILIFIKNFFEKNKLSLTLILVVSFIIIFVGGHLIQPDIHQRYFYKFDHLKETSEDQFNSDNTYFAARWFKESIDRYSNILGDYLIFDTIGVYSYLNVRTDKYFLYNHVLTNTLTKNDKFLIKFYEINYIITNHYSKKFISFKKRYGENYDLIIDNNPLFDKVYSNNILSGYYFDLD